MTNTPNHPLGEAIARGLIDHHEHMRVTHADHRHAEKIDFLEHIEREGVEAIGQILGARIDAMDLPEETRELLDRFAKPEHAAEVGAIVGILAAVGYMLGGAVLAGPVAQLTMASMRTVDAYPIQPESLAQGVVTNRMTYNDALDMSKNSGAYDGALLRMMDLSKQTLPPSQWVQFWNQFPDQQGLADNGLSHSGLDEESLAALKALHWRPMDLGIAVSAVTQNQITMPQFEYLLGQNGVNPEWAKVIFESSGATMPPDMAMRLYREGWIDTAKFEEILTESTLKNKYVPDMKNLRFRFPPMEQILRMYRHGELTEPEANEYLIKLGFFPDIAAKLVRGANSTTTHSVKQLSPSAIIDMYEVGHWDAGTTQSHLTALGYDAQSAQDLIFLADEKMKYSRSRAAANKVGTRYTGWKIDRASASHQLDSIGIKPDQRDDMLDDWDAVREATTIHLSFADLKKAFGAKLLTADQIKQRLLASGHDVDDTDILMKLYFGES